MQLQYTSCFIEIFVTMLVLYIVFCQFFCAVALDISEHIEDIGEKFQILENQFNFNRCIRLKRKLFEIIEFHVEAKQLKFFKYNRFIFGHNLFFVHSLFYFKDLSMSFRNVLVIYYLHLCRYLQRLLVFHF